VLVACYSLMEFCCGVSFCCFDLRNHSAHPSADHALQVAVVLRRHHRDDLE